MHKKNIAFISPVGSGGPKILYKNLVTLLQKKDQKNEYTLISSIKSWICLHFFNKKHDIIVSSIPFFWKPPHCIYIMHYNGLFRQERGLLSIGGLLSRLYPYNSLFADMLVYPSRFLMKYYKLKHKNQKVIYNIIKIDIDEPIHTPKHNKNHYNFLTVTNFHFYDKAKGIIDICNKLSEWNPDVNVTYRICGGGRYKEKIEQQIRKMKISKKINIIFLGEVNYELVVELLKSADIFLYSTFQDTFSISIIEAMSFGIPVVLNNYELFYEIYENEFITKDSNEFIEKINLLIHNKHYYKQYIDLGYKNIKSIDIEASISKRVTIINHFIK